MNLFALSDNVAVVIGGTAVIGGAIAEGLASAGARLAIVRRSSERGHACVNRIKEKDGQAAFFWADASSKESLLNAKLMIEQTLGSPSILVNAAGGNDPKATVTPEQSVEAISVPSWMATFDLNLVSGALLPCQVFGSSMLALLKGSIINIASVSAHLPLSRVVAYSAAKAAVLNFTQFLAREWAPHGVRVNSITPGFFPAEQNYRLLFNEDGSPTPRAAAILDHTPMHRFGQPHELVGAAVFLASPAASFVTGIDLRVDGGFLSQTI